jgi:tetratricopeptide (TPR) repeat protein
MTPLSKRRSARTLAMGAGLILLALQVAGCTPKAQRAQNYYESGLNYLKQNDYVKARLEIRNALQLKGDMVEAWRTLARIDELSRNYRELGASLRRVVELDPKDVGSTLALGKLYLLAGDIDNALKMANSATAMAPNDVGALALKAGVLFRLKDTDGTIETAQKALAIDPGNTEASVVLAVAKFSKGDSTAALHALDGVKQAEKDDLGVLYLKVNILDRIGDAAQAETALRRLIEVYPKEPMFRAQLIKFLLQHKRQDDAIAELRTAAAANADDVAAEMNLVNLLRVAKGADAARTELTKRISAGGKIFSYQIALAKFDFGEGKLNESTGLLKQLIANSKTSEETLTAQITLADIYVTKNNFAAAEPLVTDILKADNRNTEGLRLRASIRINHGDFDNAIADLRTALNDKPRSPELMASLGLAYERSGSIELADKAYYDATTSSGFSPAYGLNYIAFLRRRGLGDRADSVLADLASRNPNSVEILSTLAQAKLAHQDWAGAHAVADAIRRLGDKRDISAADQISGAALIGQKKFTDSLAMLESAYGANPGAIQPMASLVSAYLQARQIDKAEAFVKSALQANPQNAEALVLMGSVQLAKNNQEGAAKQFNEAIKQRPKDAIGYRALSELYIRQKNIDAAIATLQTGLQQAPDSFDLRMALAGLLEAKGEFEPAIAAYDRLLKDQPGSMVVANNLASLLTDHRSDKASLERANSLALLLKNSQVPQFKDTIGWINYRQGDLTGATTQLETAVTELPRVAMIHYHLGMTYLATGQDSKATDEFNKARELAPFDVELKNKIDAALKDRPAKPKGANG